MLGKSLRVRVSIGSRMHETRGQGVKHIIVEPFGHLNQFTRIYGARIDLFQNLGQVTVSVGSRNVNKSLSKITNHIEINIV